MNKKSMIKKLKTTALLAVLFFPRNAFAGNGYLCERGGKEYFDNYFQEQFLVRVEYCQNDKGEAKVAIRNSADREYPKCSEYGWKDYDIFERDFWGKEKCDSFCKTALGEFMFSEAQKACNARSPLDRTQCKIIQAGTYYKGVFQRMASLVCK